MVVPESEAASQGEVESPLQLQGEQHNLGESGKDFEFMNMDEFLKSIWTAEENQAAQAQVQPHPHASASFGEMTMEDFLVRAGVVREQGNIAPPPYAAMYPNPNNTPTIAPTYVARPIIGLGGGAVPAYQPLPLGGVVYGGRMGSGTAMGYPLMQGLGLGSLVSPVSSGGLCVNPGVVGGNHYGLETRILGRGRGGGRKRIIDFPVEKLVEIRQRRMIKNRQSAARSRAKKQAYTAELEEEVNQLKEENASLKQALAEMDKKRKQEAFEEVKPTTPTKANEKLRRTLSCPL